MDTPVCYATYKGYCLLCTEEADGRLHGRVHGIRDIVTFHGDSPDALQRAFEEAVDDYLAVCGDACLLPDLPA
jgi:predicted HicB family RNase H-like nuclease